MIELVDAGVFLRKQHGEELVVVDTRSPGEFAQGHLAGSHSVPLFDDAERARVGTTYKQVNPREAVLAGLEIVGPKMRSMVERVDELTGGRRKVGLYCWRGGSRSASVAWLLETAGYEVTRLEGGYKAYRQHARELFDDLPFEFRVVDGSTGSGKTVLLRELERLDEQVLDLEGIANHRGSAFGLAPGAVQPSTEQAENLIYERLRGFDVSRPVWVENESRNVGRVFLPDGIVNALAEGHRVELVVSTEDRVAHIVDVYGDYPGEHLVNVFVHLRKRLGGLATQEAIAAVDAKDLATAVRIALVYYDKSYAHYSGRQSPTSAERVEARVGELAAVAERLVRPDS